MFQKLDLFLSSGEYLRWGEAAYVHYRKFTFMTGPVIEILFLHFYV